MVSKTSTTVVREGGGAGSRAGREERLARALRDNLKRRKAQERARRGSPQEAEQAKLVVPDRPGES